MNQQSEKTLLNLEEFCIYLGIGKNKAKEITEGSVKFIYLQDWQPLLCHQEEIGSMDRNSGN